MPGDDTTLQIDMATLRRDVAHISNAISRIDSALITIVEHNQKLALQEVKIDVLSRDLDRQGRTLATLEERFEKDISTVKESAHEERIRLHQEIIVKLDNFAIKSEGAIDTVNKKVDKHDRFIYYVSAVIGIVIAAVALVPIIDTVLGWFQ